MLDRDSCFLQYGQDLNMLDRDMKNVILVDDNKGTASFYAENSIVVPPSRGSPIDTILTREFPGMLKNAVGWMT
jgi:hypothetical protein